MIKKKRSEGLLKIYWLEMLKDGADIHITKKMMEKSLGMRGEPKLSVG